MATETRRSRILIEAWSGVTTTNVIPDGQERWYDGVTGYQATEVIRLVGDDVTTIASLLKRQELTDSAQTLYGVKTFDSIPVLPATAPTTANQAMSKTHAEALLGLPAGYIYGLETSSDTDTDHDVLIAVGKCRDSSDTVDIELTTAMTKQIDATWAAGDDAGGMFTGTVAADTTYHLFAILKDSDDSVDLGWDTDIDCSNIPTGYTEYRRIRSYVTDASSNILPTIQSGNIFIHDVPILDYDTNMTTTAANISLSVPSDIYVMASVNVGLSTADGESVYLWQPDTTGPSSISNTYNLSPKTAKATVAGEMTTEILTNTSGQIKGDASGTQGTAIYTLGWSENRGQYGGK